MPRKKVEKTKTKLELFVDWNRRPFVDKMLDDGISANKVTEWVNENGFEISVPTMYSYARKRKEAIVRGLQLEIAMGRRGLETKVKNKKVGRKPDAEKPDKNERKDVAKRRESAKDATEYRVKSDLELLDEIIQKGYETLAKSDSIRPETAVKAVELKHKLTGGTHGGLTVYGLEEIRLREAARESAMLTILLEFIEEERHGEVIDRMEIATREYYESLGMGEAYREAVEPSEEETPQEENKGEELA